MKERFTRADWRLLAICAAAVAVSLFVVFRWFSAAFPEASIDFRYDRTTSLRVAEPLLAGQHIDVRGMKHTATFDSDDNSRIFLERSVGLARANEIMRHDVHLWWWSHRWFRPLQEEEFRVDVAPTGEITAFNDRIPEDRQIASPDVAAARWIAERFLTAVGVKMAELQLVAQSERRLPNRMQRIFTYHSQSIHPAGAPYRFEVRVDGDRVSSYAQSVRVPDEWQRQYRELRSKNLLAGNIDLVFMLITGIAVAVVFVTRLLRGDMPIRLLLGIGITTVILYTGVALNSYPSALAGYDTTDSYPAFLAQFVFGSLIFAVGWGMLLIVVVGSGEVLYRERLPQHLAIPRLWTRRALASKRVFLSFILGYSLVAFFLGYQVAFYIVAEKFGAWSPAEVPYDNILSSALPWVAVLFAGFLPAVSEEFLSRAFSIPFFERVLRSRIAAIVVAAFIWGFGHSTYANQPFYIRGVEVGMAGVVLGLLFFRFGLLPLLIWHFTVDALYTALLLLRSGNRYYVVSGALASLVFAVPMLVSLALYFRNGGFVPDEELSNATLPVKPVPERAEQEEVAIDLPPAIPVTRAKLIACGLAVAAAIACVVVQIPSIDDVIDYRITRREAKEIARPALSATPRTRFVAVPVEGFRSWDTHSGREEGGSPGGFDAVAVGYIRRAGLSMHSLIDVMRTKIPTATWLVRAFTPLQKEETIVEVDPRAARVVGYHKYQDEKRAGPQLMQPAALEIAQSAFARYGVDLRAFELKEALSFQQPNRRDWLFHFQERQPIAGQAYRRVSVRVQGAEVSQFTTTIKVPEVVYREPTTLLKIVLYILKLGGTLSLLALVIAGFVVTMRRQRFPWRRALRWTLVLAIIPLAHAVADWETILFTYSTSVAWQTFIASQVTTLARSVGLQLGLLFLAIVAIEVAYPEALELRRRPGRARFGPAAVIAALTTIGLLTAQRQLLAWIALRLPALDIPHGLDVPQSVSWPAPAILTAADALTRALIGSAAIGLLVAALRSLPSQRWLPATVAVVAMFLASLDPAANAVQTPLMLFSAATTALLAWIAARFILGANLLAYPVTIAALALLSNAAFLLQNHRADLIANGVAEIAIVVASMTWLASRREATVA